jgi:hypothetical protein
MSDERTGPRVSAGPQRKVQSGLPPGRVTAHGVTTWAHLPRAEPAAGSGSGMRHMPRRPGGGFTATAGNGGPEAEPEREADEPEFAPASLESLRQVLDGLRRLN